uniref:Ubiquitin-like domain-containing protein n=1 Tax=Magallana gigas TaxID=29159 RepID=A0A8W8LZ74_MAGGI
MEIAVLHAKSGKTLATVTNVTSKSTILDVKKEYQKKNPKYYITRQAFKVDPKGKALKDDETLGSLGLSGKRALCISKILVHKLVGLPCFYRSMQVLWPFIWSFTPGQPLSMAQLQHLNQEPRWSTLPVLVSPSTISRGS